MKTWKIAVIGLSMGRAWAEGVVNSPNMQLSLVYDPNWNKNEALKCAKELCEHYKITRAEAEEDIYNSDVDIVVVASPDHFHADQCIKALRAGKNVICEKPLAPTVADCRKIIAVVGETAKFFMTGQVCRYAPGFRTAKQLIGEGRIGDICYIESEYAHDYAKSPGFDNWRKDPEIKREGFLGGGCHALDLVRWLAGDPFEVFCYTNRKHLPDWPTDDTGICIMKFPNGAIGKVFVSIGVKRPYTMRTVINGTKGTIICDNTTDFIQISEEGVYETTKKLCFSKIPVLVNNHNVQAEIEDFVMHISHNESIPTDVIQGTRTVALAEAALLSAKTGKSVCIDYDFDIISK